MDMQQLAQAEAVLKSLHDLIGKQLKETKAQMQEEMEATGASRVGAALPNGTKVATVYSTDPKPAAVVVDEEKFLAWVREHSKDNIVSRVVTEVRPAFQAAILAELTAVGAAVWANKETGEAVDVDGVEVKATRGRGHSVRLTDGAHEAIAAAWQAGELGHLVLPQLTTGGAE